MYQRRWLFALLIIGWTGCTVDMGTNSRAAKRAELAANRSRWIAAGIQSYLFTYTHHCFCTPDTVREKSIVVQNGTIVSATFVDDGSAVPADVLADLQTINDLFDEIEYALSEPDPNPGYGLVFVYDADLGYPRSISFAAPPSVQDGGSHQTATLTP